MTKLVVTLGTSLTYGYAWHEFVRQELSRAGQDDAVMVNFGGGGQTSTWGLTRVAEIIRLRPWAVTIEFGMNDPEYLTIQQSDDNLTSIINQLKPYVAANRIFAMTMNRCINYTGSVPPRNAVGVILRMNTHPSLVFSVRPNPEPRRVKCRRTSDFAFTALSS